MFIHKVDVEETVRHEIDQRRGLVARKEQVLKASTTHRLRVDGQEFEAVDGTFDVPDDIAAIFLRMPGWFEGPNPFSLTLAGDADTEAARAELAKAHEELEAQRKAFAEERAKVAAELEAQRKALVEQQKAGTGK